MECRRVAGIDAKDDLAVAGQPGLLLQPEAERSGYPRSPAAGIYEEMLQLRDGPGPAIQHSPAVRGIPCPRRGVDQFPGRLPFQETLGDP